MNDKKAELRKKAMALPLTPGVYIMKNKDDKIIYIGKAKALKNRVSQYFGSGNNHTPKVKRMVENVDHFDYILCDSEFEALVLECSLIKKHMPKYNILLKDSKGYSYVKITPNPWGNIYASFRKDDKAAAYLGPYTGNYSVTNSVDEAKEIFKLPTCSKVFPRDIGKSRPCLNFHIGRCMAPCAGKVRREEYEAQLQNAVNFIKNGRGDVVKHLTEQMQKAAENLDFETAAKIRDRLKSIERIGNRQKVIISEKRNMDVFAISQSDKKSCLSSLSFRHGVMQGSEHFIFDTADNLSEAYSQLIAAYYLSEREIPPEILCFDEIDDKPMLSQMLSDKRKTKVQISTPQRGTGRELANMAFKNASRHLGDYLGRKGSETAALDELKKALGLKKIPKYIESYDISHTDGADNVCGMVVFVDGRPFKKGYKKFAIKGFSGQDDYGSMREVIGRRLQRYLDERGTDSTFATLPDLILLDGGQGQVNAVLPVVRSFNLDIPVFGMVKDNKHRTRAIASDGGEIHISDGRALFSLVSNIQEEVHRFAITYHKKKHAKSTMELTLTQIPSIGQKKAQALLKHFKSKAKIENASVEELQKVDQISKSNAENIYKFFHE